MNEYLKKLSLQLIGTALGGVIAIGGSWYLYTLQQAAAEIAKKRENLEILRQEVANNVNSAEEFIEDTLYRQYCREPKNQSPIVRGRKRAAFREFDVSAWNLRSVYVSIAEYPEYSNFYTKVRQANYIARKIQYGEYQTEEGILFLEAALAIYQMREEISGLPIQGKKVSYELTPNRLSVQAGAPNNAMQPTCEDAGH